MRTTRLCTSAHITPKLSMFVYVQRGYTQFRPHFMVQKCLDSSSSQTCQDNCVNNGRYCAMDSLPEGLQSSYNGRQVHIADCKT